MPEKQRLLELALKGLEADRAKLDEEIAEIRRQLGRGSGVTTGQEAATTSPPPRQRRRMSAEAKRKISEAMKRRYAEMRKIGKKKAA
jgi:hypothetical protein